MTRFKFTLCVASLLGLATVTNHSWAQSEILDDQVVTPKSNNVQLPQNPEAGTPVPTSDSFEGDPSPSNEEVKGDRRRGGLRRTKNANPSDAASFGATEAPIGYSVNRTVPVHVATPEEQLEAQELKYAIIDAMNELRDAQNDEEKAIARSKIKELFDKQFERDLKRREDELAPLEERVKALRKQLDKRKAAKADILNTRVMTIVLNAEGLGFRGDEGALDGTDSARPHAGAIRARKPSSKPPLIEKDLKVIENDFKGDFPQPREKSTKKK